MGDDDDDEVDVDDRLVGGGRSGSRNGFAPRSNGGGTASRSGGKQPDALRISQAAQALAARLVGATTSTEAMQAHATALFRRSAEVSGD